MADKDNKEKSQEHFKAILKALDQVIKFGPWKKSVLLQAMQQKLTDLRVRFSHEARLSENQNHQGSAATLAGRVAQRSGLVPVYAVLYNAAGNDINRWEGILNNIQAHIVSRPVYREEKEAKAILRAATNKQNEAFVEVYIHQEDINEIDLEHVSRDKLGHPLLSIHESAIKKTAISRFVHKSGAYQFEHGKLVWLNAVEFL